MRRPQPVACPDWCTTDHVRDLEIEGDLRLHRLDVPMPAGVRPVAALSVVATDNLSDGVRSATELSVLVRDTLNAAEARALALALLDGIDYLAEADDS